VAAGSLDIGYRKGYAPKLADEFGDPAGVGLRSACRPHSAEFGPFHRFSAVKRIATGLWIAVYTNLRVTT
jgi:hypothetical protein